MPFTLDNMHEVIRKGGSVLYKNRLCTRPEHLPSPAEYHAQQGDLTSAIEALNAQINELTAKRDALLAKQTAATAKTDETPGTPAEQTKEKPIQPQQRHRRAS